MKTFYECNNKFSSPDGAACQAKNCFLLAGKKCIFDPQSLIKIDLFLSPFKQVMKGINNSFPKVGKKGEWSYFIFRGQTEKSNEYILLYFSFWLANGHATS